jgi:tRNA C32,U32 (ribose-2'-O)-methylase TrmJ
VDQLHCIYVDLFNNTFTNTFIDFSETQNYIIHVHKQINDIRLEFFNFSSINLSKMSLVNIYQVSKSFIIDKLSFENIKMYNSDIIGVDQITHSMSSFEILLTNIYMKNFKIEHSSHFLSIFLTSSFKSVEISNITFIDLNLLNSHLILMNIKE